MIGQVKDLQAENLNQYIYGICPNLLDDVPGYYNSQGLSHSNKSCIPFKFHEIGQIIILCSLKDYYNKSSTAYDYYNVQKF